MNKKFQQHRTQLPHSQFSLQNIYESESEVREWEEIHTNLFACNVQKYTAKHLPENSSGILSDTVIAPTESEVIELCIIFFFSPCNRQTTCIMNNPYPGHGKEGYDYQTFHHQHVMINLCSIEFSALQSVSTGCSSPLPYWGHVKNFLACLFS